MEKTKRLFLFIFTIFLLSIASGMFYLQNYYLPQATMSQKTVVYLANKELNPLTAINEQDFNATYLPSAAISSDYVLNLKDVVDLPLKNSLYSGEILSYSHLSDKEIDSDKNLLTTIVPKYYDNINTNDLVNVYVIKADKDTKIISIETIYLAKKVEKTTSTETKTNAKDAFAFSVIVSEAEMESYYTAQHAGEILATKIVNPNLIDIVSNLTPFNPSEIVFNQSTEEAAPDGKTTEQSTDKTATEGNQ